MSIQTDKLMNLGDGKVLYDDLRERVDSQSVPTGGLEGQVLVKKSGKARDVKWQNIPHELPLYGNSGDILYKNTGSDYDVKWGAPRWILDYTTKENYSNQENIKDAADGQPIGFKITLPLVQEGSGDPAIDNIRKFKKYTGVSVYTDGPNERSSSVYIDLTSIPGGVYGGVLEVTKDGTAIFTRSHYVFGYDSGSSTQYGDYVFISKYANFDRSYIRSTDFSASSFSTVTGIDKDKVCYEPPVLNGAVSMPYYATVPYGTNIYDLQVAVGLNVYWYNADRYTLPRVENLPISYANVDGYGFAVSINTNNGTLDTPFEVTYAISPKAYTDSKATVQDVQVNGASVVQNGIANIEIEALAGSITLGKGTADEVTLTAANVKALLALLN